MKRMKWGLNNDGVTLSSHRIGGGMYAFVFLRGAPGQMGRSLWLSLN
jgi:hypothetical protein